jgi:predicted ATPase
VTRLAKLSVRGFKSIRELKDFELSNLNVLIGANGAGKSNFISLFRMFAEMLAGRLQRFVVMDGGPDALLFCGRKQTGRIEASVQFDHGRYKFDLAAIDDRLLFLQEQHDLKGIDSAVPPSLEGIYAESFLSAYPDTFAPLRGLRVLHLNDTSRDSRIRNAQQVRDNLVLKEDGANLAPFLRMLRQKYPHSYASILRTVRMVAPFFDDFVNRPDAGLDDRIDLEWYEVGDPRTPRGTSQLSDGTLRFICLATLLLQPDQFQPSTIVIDEPELGLHPYAIDILVALLQQASDKRQIIVSTQSVDLVNGLSPSDIVVTERRDGASVFRRLDAGSLKEWLEDYSLGELWKMNVVGGSPTR